VIAKADLLPQQLLGRCVSMMFIRCVMPEALCISWSWRAKLMDAGVSDADIRYLAANLYPV
jgi:hypothetical protein